MEDIGGVAINLNGEFPHVQNSKFIFEAFDIDDHRTKRNYRDAAFIENGQQL